jgi:hypothetical protein
VGTLFVLLFFIIGVWLKFAWPGERSGRIIRDWAEEKGFSVLELRSCEKSRFETGKKLNGRIVATVWNPPVCGQSLAVREGMLGTPQGTGAATVDHGPLFSQLLREASVVASVVSSRPQNDRVEAFGFPGLKNV